MNVKGCPFRHHCRDALPRILFLGTYLYKQA